MVQTADTIFRDFETDGVPASGKHKPKKAEIRPWGTWLESLYSAAQAGGGLAYETKADMDADLAHAANQIAWVMEDPTAANNGIYAKVGASGSGSWTRLGDLPYSYIKASNAGAGTANAVVATTSIPIPAADGGALVALPIVADNTASPVTVSFNGGAVLTIKTSSGNDVAAGGLTSGMVAAGYVSGSTFRLLSDQAGAAIVEAAEAAAARAEAAAAGLNIPAIQAGDAGKILSVNAAGSGYEVVENPPAGSALKNRVTDTISPFDPTYGALGGANDDRQAVQDAMDAAAAAKVALLLGQPVQVAGQLTTANDLHIRWNTGAWAKQTAFSDTGSFVQNLRSSSADAASIQSNITLENPQLDGSLFPDPIALEVSSASSNTVTFAIGASGVDDFYNGFLVEDTSGANGGGLRVVTDYVGSTRTATINLAWTSIPTTGTTILAGWNDNAIGCAAGVSAVSVLGGQIKNYPADKMVPSATGGKAINFEQGVTNGRQIGVHAENVGTAFFTQGVDGAYANGAKRRAAAIIIAQGSAKNVGSLLTIAGTNSSADPDGDSDDSLVLVSDLTYENAGHSPWRLVPSDQQKSGIINFLEAQNVSISNVRGRNDATYPSAAPGYPTDYAARCGYGLTGNIGALIWGWGRNLKVDGFVHHGNVDNVIVVRRGRALGDDAGATGAPQNCFNWSMRGIEVHGVVNEYVIRIDPTSGLRVSNTELTGEIEVAVSGAFVTLGLCDPNMATFSGITLTIRDHLSGKKVIGTPAQIIAAGNDFESFGSGTTDLRIVFQRQLNGLSYSLADDSALSITPPSTAGIAAVVSNTSLLRVLIAYRSGSAGAQCVCIGTEPLLFTADNTPGTLIGTTGTDTEFTVRCDDDGLLWIENRRGAKVDFTVTFIGAGA